MTPEYAASIAFLLKFHENRRWVLTAIHPDPNHKPRTSTCTFDAKHVPDCLKWLNDKGSIYNIYFSVNSITKYMLKKAERTDIDAVVWLHVDIDPNTGEPIPEEQARILATLQGTKRPEVLPGKLPPPTLITFSGGGYQGFWKLSAPINLAGELTLAEDAKLYNLGIEILLGADNCHNVDRIMRLPGTINRPDEKKKAKGRTEALSVVIDWNEDRVYDISCFAKSDGIKTVADAKMPDFGVGTGTPKSSGSKAAKDKYVPPANIVRINDLQELPVADWVRALINVGYDPVNPHPLLPKKYESRSEALFAVVCALNKAHVPNDTIYSVLTDDRFGISSSVLDKGSKAERYARRQIDRAGEESQHPWLRALNERFAVIESISGKCRVVEEEYDDALDRSRLVKQSFEDFQNRYCNIKVPLGFNDDGKPIEKPLGMWWLTQPHRRQYKRIVFSPGKDDAEAYNLWRGFGCEARPGDCSLFLKHVLDNVCSGNQEYFEYLMKWFANAVQNPDRPGCTAVVLKGEQGTGKGMVAKTFGSLFGRHFMQISDSKHLVGSFNAHLRDCVVLFADEAFFAGDKAHANTLKTLVTEERLSIESKGIDVEQAPNCVHLLMASNDHFVVPAGIGDRRFFVLHISKAKKEDTAYFGAMVDQLANGGREALLHMLMTMDIAKFDVRTMPKTEELQQQKLMALPTEEAWWRERLHEGRLLPEHGGWQKDVTEGDLYYDYLTYAKNSRAYKNVNKLTLASVLKKYVPGLMSYPTAASLLVVQPDGNRKMIERPMVYHFPTLSECRLAWEKQFGGKEQWPSDNGPNTTPDLDYKDFIK